MKIGIALGTVRPERWTEVGCEIDRLGYESLWMPEHLVLPVAADGSPYAGADHPPIPSDVPVFDAFAYLSYLAGRTEQSGSAPTSTTSASATPSPWPGHWPRSTSSPGGGRSSASGPAGWKPNGMPSALISPAEAAASTRPSRCANGCGANR